MASLFSRLDVGSVPSSIRQWYSSASPERPVCGITPGPGPAPETPAAAPTVADDAVALFSGGDDADNDALWSVSIRFEVSSALCIACDYVNDLFCQLAALSLSGFFFLSLGGLNQFLFFFFFFTENHLFVDVEKYCYFCSICFATIYFFFFSRTVHGTTYEKKTTFTKFFSAGTFYSLSFSHVVRHKYGNRRFTACLMIAFDDYWMRLKYLKMQSNKT